MSYFRSMFLLLLIFVISFESFSQKPNDFKITWGKEETLGFKSASVQLIGEIDGYFYLYQGSGRSSGFDLTPEIGLLKLDNELKIVNENAIKLDGTESDRDLEATYIKDKKLYFLTSDEIDDRYKLYLESIDIETLKSNNDVRLILDAEDNTGLRNHPNFIFRTSSDTSYNLVIYKERGEDKDFKFWVFDGKWNQLWKAGNVGKDDLYVKSYDITNNGNVYLLTNNYNYGGLFSDGTYDYALWAYFGSEKNKSEFDLGEKIKMDDVSVMELENDHVAVAGFYKNLDKKSEMGSFFISLDETARKIKTKEFTSFGPDFLAFGNGDSDQRKIRRKYSKGKDVGLGNIIVRKTIRREDGGILVIGEEYDITSSGNDVTHYFDDIYLINYDPSGSIRWQHKVPKQQRTKGYLYTSMSFMTAVNGTDVYLFFNDNDDNANYKGPGNPKVLTGTVVMMMVKIDGDGNKTRKIADNLNFKQKFLSMNSSQFGDNNEAFLFAQSLRNFRFGKLEFTD